MALRRQAVDKVDRLLSEASFREEIEEFLEDIWIAPFLDKQEIRALRKHPGLEDFFERMFPLALRNAFVIEEVSPVRRLLDSHADRFVSEERRFLQDYDDAKLTYVQFREFFPEEGYCLAEDIFDGKVFTIHDKNLARQTAIHSIASARLVPLEPEALDFALAENLKAEGAPVEPRDYLALLKGDPIVFYWMELFILHQALCSGPARMRNTDGDKLVFMTGRFSCPDPGALRIGLEGQRNFLRQEGGGPETWIWTNNRKLALGTLRFEPGGKEIVVETNSRERFRKWERKLLALGAHILLEKQEKPLDAALEEHPLQPEEKKGSAGPLSEEGAGAGSADGVRNAESSDEECRCMPARRFKREVFPA